MNFILCWFYSVFMLKKKSKYIQYPSFWHITRLQDAKINSFHLKYLILTKLCENGLWLLCFLGYQIPSVHDQFFWKRPISPDVWETIRHAKMNAVPGVEGDLAATIKYTRWEQYGVLSWSITSFLKLYQFAEQLCFTGTATGDWRRGHQWATCAPHFNAAVQSTGGNRKLLPQKHLRKSTAGCNTPSYGLGAQTALSSESVPRWWQFRCLFVWWWWCFVLF